MPGCKEWGRARETGSSGQALRGRTQDKEINVLEGNDHVGNVKMRLDRHLKLKLEGELEIRLRTLYFIL